MKVSETIQSKPTDLIVTSGFQGLAVTLMPYANTVKKELLDKASNITVIWDKESQEQGNALMKEIKAVLNKVEATRKEVKNPALEFGKKVDEIAKTYIEELQAAHGSLSKQLGQYQLKLEEDEAKRKREEWEKQQKIEAELNAKLAKAKNEDEAKRALEIATKKLEASKQAEALAVPEKPKGMSVVKNPCFEITDLALAFKAHPELFIIEPSKSKINEAIRGGLEKAEGFKIWWETVAR